MAPKAVEVNQQKTSNAMTEALADVEALRHKFFTLKETFEHLKADNMERRMYMFQCELLMEMACSLKICEFQLKRMGLVNWEELSLHAGIWFEQHQD